MSDEDELVAQIMSRRQPFTKQKRRGHPTATLYPRNKSKPT